MNLKHFGDSYDVVKKSLLQWLAEFGPWAAHPTFTHHVSEAEAVSFSRFLGVPLVSTEILTADHDRRAYLTVARQACPSLFFDPDTGVRLRSRRGKGSVKFIFGDELLEIADARTKGLLLVFDQSLPFGGEREAMEGKLDYLRDRGVLGFAYVSHASFMVLGKSEELVDQAKARLLDKSGLPEARIVTAPPQSQSVAGTLAG